MSPWRKTVIFLVLWRATGTYPISLNSACNCSGCGWAYSTNSKPSVPIGLASDIVAAGASCGNGPMAKLLFWLWRIFSHIERNVHAKQRAFG